MASGYGTEIYCTSRLRTGKYVTGRVALAHAIYRRLTTPRGTLRGGDEEQTYGLDLPGMVGNVAAALLVRALPGMIAAELGKDDRISSVLPVVTASTDAAGAVSLEIAIRVVPVDEDEEFSLTLAVSTVSVELLGIAA